MRVLTLRLASILSIFTGAALTMGCGAGAMSERTQSAPAAYPQPVSGTVSKAEAHEDHDSDGIPDKADAMPMGQLACMSSAGGCGNLMGAPPPPPPAPGQPAAPPAQQAAQAAAAQAAQAAQREGAYLIYTANLTMAVYQVEGALGTVEQIGRDVGGYLAVRQDHSITIRVPRGRFDEAIKRIESTGDVTHRDIQVEDVSDEFLDTEVRLKNARAMRDRLQELLQKAAVKDALEIEKELGRITQEMERMEGRIKVLRDKIAFSTITVNFDARSASLHTMPIRLPFGWLQTLGLPTLLRLNETK